MSEMPKDVTCPFCQESGFDLAGLKLHFERDWCDVYSSLEAESIEDRIMKNRGN